MVSEAVVVSVVREPELLFPVPPVLAHLVVDSVLLLHLLCRQSFSVAMAGISP